MKKEIMALIDSAEGTFRINNIATLRRWTRDGIGNKVDMLVIAFDPINGISFGDDTVQLNQRTFEGIIVDCERAINNHMKIVTNTLMSNLENGYVNTSKGGTK